MRVLLFNPGVPEWKRYAPIGVIVKNKAGEVQAVETRRRRLIYAGSSLADAFNAAFTVFYDESRDFYDGSIYIGPGRYTVTERIDLPARSHLRIIGDGVHTTILKFTGFNATAFSSENSGIRYSSSDRVYDKPFYLPDHVVVDYSQHLELRGFTIDTQDEKYVNGLYLENIDRVYIVNLRFKGYYSETTGAPSAVVSSFAIYVDTIANNEIHIENVKASGYYTAFRIKGDHLYAANAKTGRCYVGYNMAGGIHHTILHPETYQTQGYHFIFNSTTGAKTIVVNPSIEGASNSVGFQVNSWGDKPIVVNPYVSGISALASDYSKLAFTGNGVSASGVATIASGETRVTVSHGLAAAPAKVYVTPYAQVKAWVENIGDTNFDIVIDASQSNDVQVAWRAEL